MEKLTLHKGKEREKRARERERERFKNSLEKRGETHREGET